MKSTKTAIAPVIPAPQKEAIKAVDLVCGTFKEMTFDDQVHAFLYLKDTMAKSFEIEGKALEERGVFVKQNYERLMKG